MFLCICTAEDARKIRVRLAEEMTPSSQLEGHLARQPTSRPAGVQLGNVPASRP